MAKINVDVTFPGLRQQLPRLLDQMERGKVGYVRVMESTQSYSSQTQRVSIGRAPIGFMIGAANFGDDSGAGDSVKLSQQELLTDAASGRVANLLRAVKAAGLGSIAPLATAARATISCVAAASLVNGDKFELGDGVGANKTFEYDKDATLIPASASNVMINLSGAARATLNPVAAASIADNATVVLDDGTNAATTFIFDAAGDGVVGGTAIDISAATTATDVANAIRSAVNNVGAGLAITAFGTGAVVYLRNDAVGAAGNTTISGTAIAGSFTKTNFTGGAAAPLTTAAAVATATAAAISSAMPNLTAASSDAVVSLTNKIKGTIGNVPIVETVANAGFLVSGFSDGQLLGALMVIGADRNGDVLYTSRRGGPASANIRVRHVVAGNNTPLTVSVAQGPDITVNVATGPGGAVTSTAAQIAAAVNASIVKGDVLATAQGNGTGLTAAAGFAALTAGPDRTGKAGPLIFEIVRHKTDTKPRAILISYDFATLLSQSETPL